MPFKRFVETGRVALVADGPHKGKLVSIVDVIDQTRVLVDGPETKVSRGQIRLNQLHLTKFRLRFPYTGSTRVVRKAWKDAKINEQWSNSVWAKKLEAKKRRAAMGDFDRFKLRRARSRRNHIRTKVFYNLRMKASRNGMLYGKKAKGGDKPKPKKEKKRPAATSSQEKEKEKEKEKPAKVAKTSQPKAKSAKKAEAKSPAAPKK